MLFPTIILILTLAPLCLVAGDVDNGPAVSSIIKPWMFSVHVATNTNWKCSTEHEEGWIDIEFDDRFWNKPRIVHDGSLPLTVEFITAQDDYAPVMYFREQIWSSEGNTVKLVTVAVRADDGFELYFNGTLVGEDPHAPAGPFMIFNVTDLWQEGANCCAIKVINECLIGHLFADICIYLGVIP